MISPVQGVVGLLPLVLLKQVSHQMVRRGHCPACLYAEISLTLR